MPAGLATFPALCTARRQLLATAAELPRRIRPFGQLTTINARSPFSSIADAMLGRAVQKKASEQPAPRSTLDKGLFSNSPATQNGKIDEEFKKARQSSQSIGGFTGYKNTAILSNPNPPKPLRPKSPNARHCTRERSESFASLVSSNTSSLFSNPSAFLPPQVRKDAGSIQPPKPSLGGMPSTPLWDENDFDDDVDLDKEFEPQNGGLMAAPPKPIIARQPAKSPSPYTLPQAPRTVSQPEPTPSSSQVTWESSSPSHKRTPPGMKRQREEAQSAVLPSIETTSDPRPAKRRNLPWLDTRAEKAEYFARLEQEEQDNVAAMVCNNSFPPEICIHCKGAHSSTKCPQPGKWNYTPKEKSMPWNNTGSAIREEKKKLRERQKTSQTSNITQKAALDDHRSTTVKMAPISLSQEQQRIQDLVINQSKSVFFTGSAGTGKSVLMRSIIAELRKKYKRDPDRVAVTASTGLAACNVGGVTLHSFGGIGLGKEDIPALVKKIKRNQKAKNRWIKAKILIIDEISMVDGDLFDKLEGIARSMRNNGRPFGGIQLVITGDFFQLPPVPDSDNKARGIKFAFDAGTWSTAIHHTIGLTEVFRQRDPVFANMLNEMRLGKITDDTVKAFRKLNRKPEFEDALVATELFPMRHEVENANMSRMRQLVGKSYRYDAVDTGTVTDQAMRDKLLSNMMSPKTIELKKGAQVMLIKNMDDGLVNGSLGKVVAFMTEAMFSRYDQNPEILEDGVEALGEEDRRAPDKPSLTARFAANKDPNPDSSKLFPLVQFLFPDGTIRELLVLPEEWKIELPSGEVQAQRTQLPLILAWALSIHKAQGQTLERVKIDLKRIFENGQAYVALSRAVSQEGLEVHNFDKSKVMAHPRVAQFYNSLYSVNKALETPKVSRLPLPKPTVKRKETPLKSQKGEWDCFADEEELIAAYS